MSAVQFGEGAIQPPPNAREHWAFQTPRPVTAPAVADTNWIQTGIDRFIMRNLELAGLKPAEPAPPRSLIRRMSFGLTGLPPSGIEVEEFEKAYAIDRNAAIQSLIERLLASKAYGEHWGRHWLDVARYSDTKGYVYGREERRFVHAPAYRDWVIASFNHDLPYDRFLLLQIAADQLVSTNSPDLAAMGFITGGRRFIGVTHDIIDDRIDVVTRGTMALTVQCARCHDHKYDPVSIRDYYSLYGVFHASEDRLVPLKPATDPELKTRLEKLAQVMAKRREEAGARLRERIADYLLAQFETHKYPEEGFDQIFSNDDILPASVRRWRDYLLVSASKSHPIWGPWKVLAELDEKDMASADEALKQQRATGSLNPLIAEAFTTAPGSRRELAERYAVAFRKAEQEKGLAGAGELAAILYDANSPTVVPDTGIVNNDQFFPTSATEEIWKHQGEADRRLIELAAPVALIVQDKPAQPNPRVFKRGSPAMLGEEVPRRFLEVLSDVDNRPFQKGSGRLELAREIVHPDNPLTARVMVNRIWHHHFGEGLVRTPSDFGLRAEPPSHSELLDWLAQRFIESGWSIKAMHRLILASAVYQTASAPNSPSDPDNRLLAHFPIRRLAFEQLRDGMLASAGELDSSAGGRPPDLLSPSNTRRTVYSFVDRQFLTGAFRTFDFANPDIHVAVRHETTVPQQALFFLNSEFAAARARTLAERTSGGDAAARVQAMFRSVLQRTPSGREISAATQFIADAEAQHIPPLAQPPPTQWSYGTGRYDEEQKVVKNFKPFAVFTGAAWQGSESFPGGDTGWAQITAEGGHPGNTKSLACVRRWTAPNDVVVSISGTIVHEPEPGDGVRAFIVTGKGGELKRATVHKGKVEMSVAKISIKAGETIDFVVDIGGTLSHDQFLWSPVITADGRTWDARVEFNGPVKVPALLSPWAQYAQVLLLSNEFAFLD